MESTEKCAMMMFDSNTATEAAAAVLSLSQNVTEFAYCSLNTPCTIIASTAVASILSTLQSMILPFLAVILAIIVSMIFLINTDHTVLSLLKMNATVNSKKRPPVAPYGMIACVHKMTSDQHTLLEAME